MIFIINTSVLPHFCAISQKDNLLEFETWESPKLDSEKIFEFAKNNNIKDKDFDFIGGVNGFSGFSSLRSSSCILNTINFVKKTKIREIFAQDWLSNFLETENFLLDSFGDSVWVCRKKFCKNLDLKTVFSEFEETKFGIDFLSEKKQKQVKNSRQIFPKIIEKDLIQSLFKVLKTQKDQDGFHSDYQISPV